MAEAPYTKLAGLSARVGPVEVAERVRRAAVSTATSMSLGPSVVMSNQASQIRAAAVCQGQRLALSFLRARQRSGAVAAFFAHAIRLQTSSVQLALAVFGVVMLLLYPLAVVWPSGWAWESGAPYQSHLFMVAKALRGWPRPSPRCPTGGTRLPGLLLDGMRAWMRRKGYRALDN